MLSEITVTIVPTRFETQILVTVGQDEVLKARLLPATHAHPRATPMLLEALALWYQRRVRAVVSVVDDAVSSDLGLADALGFGERTVHYEVMWVDPRELGRRGGRMRGLGSFRDARRCLRVGRSR